MLKKLLHSVAALILSFGLAATAQAALQAVSPALDPTTGFPLWYQDTTGLQLQLCQVPAMCLFEIPDAEEPASVPGNFPEEAFWWQAEHIGLALPGGGTASLILAMEAAFANEQPVDGDQVVFNRIRIDFRDIPAPGTYTVTHPFGQVTYNLSPGRNVFTQDIGDFGNPGRDSNFAAALLNGPNPPTDARATVNADGRSIGPFLRAANAAGEALPFITTADGTFLASPTALNRVIGSPIVDESHVTGFQNYFRVQGPGGIALANQFNLSGQVANCGEENIAPVANNDFAAVLGVATVINVVANDIDATLNPASLLVGTSPQQGTLTKNFNGEFTYTPFAGASGVDSFTYTVQDYCGLTSAPAMVTLLLEPAETLAAARAEYRPATGKWLIQGTSTLHEPLVRLTGGEEVPPVASNARGHAQVEVNEAGDAIDYALLIDSAPATAITQAHIHVGAKGSNGPVILWLCNTSATPPGTIPIPPACPTDTGIVEGTLAAANLVPQAEQGINTFTDAIAAIRSGNAYVNVHTAGNPGGEIRGQIGNFITLRAGATGPVVGTAVVQPGTPKAWEIAGKSKASPGSEPRTIHGVSTQGRTVTIPLRLR